MALCVWYLPASETRVWGSGMRLAGVAAASALLMILGAIWWERWRRATDRYYRLLPLSRRRVVIQRRWDETVGLLGMLAFIFVLRADLRRLAHLAATAHARPMGRYSGDRADRSDRRLRHGRMVARMALAARAAYCART